MHHGWAPELLYHDKGTWVRWLNADIWSLGCLIAQILLRSGEKDWESGTLPFFSRDFSRSRKRIDLLRSGTSGLLINILSLQECRPKNPLGKNVLLTNCLGRIQDANYLNNLLGNVKVDARELVLGMLKFEPDDRITAKMALGEKYLVGQFVNGNMDVGLSRRPEEFHDREIRPFVNTFCAGLPVAASV
eukprot:TRINITY_DN1967_c0_g1_i3.p1 TRINITY_DN1967_c0_g1~~TRINITY_DN1967_c0_g1_i3.p1  ORF type:complete len:189 (-),score=23.57 TRINITY_DN1967_c0_g1_i3:95-661(-)